MSITNPLVRFMLLSLIFVILLGINKTVTL